MITQNTQLNSLQTWHRNQVRTQPAKDSARDHIQSRIQFLDEFQGFEALVDELKSADGASHDLNKAPGEVEVHSRLKSLSAIRPAVKTLTKNDDQFTIKVTENIGSAFADSPRLRVSTYEPQEDGIIAVQRTTDGPNTQSESSSVSFLLDPSQELAFAN